MARQSLCRGSPSTRARAPAPARARASATLASLAAVLLLAIPSLAASAGAAAEYADTMGPHLDALGRPVPLGFAGPVAIAGPLGPHSQDTRADISFTLEDVWSTFGPETYKYNDRANTRNPQDLENQTTTWETALGHSISFLVRIGAGDQQITCDDRFIAEAYIPIAGAGSTRLYGWTNGTTASDLPAGPGAVCTSGPPGVRLFNITFDLDGAPPTTTGDAYPALLSGFYTATLDMYHYNPTPTDPAGLGPLAGSLLIGFSIANPSLLVPEPVWSFPEATLRMFSDVGASASAVNQYQMLTRPMPLAGNTTMTVGFGATPANTTFTRLDHWVTRVGPGVDAPPIPDPLASETPLDEASEKVDDLEDRAAVTVRTTRFTSGQVPDGGAVVLNITAVDFPSQSGGNVNYVPLQVVSVILRADPLTFLTGASSLVFPVSDFSFPIRQIDVDRAIDPVAETGSTRVVLQDALGITGGTSGADAGDLFAIQGLQGGTSIAAQAQLTRQPGAKWAEGSFSHLSFPVAVAGYNLLAYLYGPNDEFFGMSLARRGVALDADAMRLVEGDDEDLILRVTNLADDYDGVPGEEEFDLSVAITASGFPDGTVYNQTVGPIPESNTLSVAIPVNAATPGVFNVRFTAQAGELLSVADTTIEVISRERAAEENRKWYEIPGPNAPITVLLVAALILLARRRPDAGNRLP